MGGITAYDFSSGVAYCEIFGLGRQEGRQEGRQTEASAITVRQLQRRCGTLSSAQQARYSGPPLSAGSKLFSTPYSTSKGLRISTPG